MTQTHTNTHVSQKVHVSKIQERVFWGKKPLLERTRSLKACKNQWRILILHKENLDFAKGESRYYTRRIYSISKKHEKVGFDEQVKF